MAQCHVLISNGKRYKITLPWNLREDNCINSHRLLQLANVQKLKSIVDIEEYCRYWRGLSVFRSQRLPAGLGDSQYPPSTPAQLIFLLLFSSFSFFSSSSFFPLLFLRLLALLSASAVHYLSPFNNWIKPFPNPRKLLFRVKYLDITFTFYTRLGTSWIEATGAQESIEISAAWWKDVFCKKWNGLKKLFWSLLKNKVWFASVQNFSCPGLSAVFTCNMQICKVSIKIEQNLDLCFCTFRNPQCYRDTIVHSYFPQPTYSWNWVRLKTCQLLLFLTQHKVFGL